MDRFEALPEPGGLWTVIDVLTGIPAMVDDIVLIGLTHEEALNMVQVANERIRISRSPIKPGRT